MLDANPDLGPRELRGLLGQTAVDMRRGGDNRTAGSTGPDIDFGAGRIDAYAALAAAGAPLDSPPIVPRHELIEGELVEGEEFKEHAIEVESTESPLALTAIAPRYDPLLSPESPRDFAGRRGVVWPGDPLLLTLRDPDGEAVATAQTSLLSSDNRHRQETLHHEPLEPGTYTVEVRSEHESVEYFIDASVPGPPPPVTQITAGPSDGELTNSRTATFGFTASEPAASFECSRDFAPWEECTSPVTYSDPPDGEHSFGVRATSPAGLTDPAPPYRTWTVDATPPVTTITSGPPAFTNSRDAELQLSVEDEHEVSFECRLEPARYEPCESPVTYAGLDEGTHTFAARATDAAGNVEGPPRSYSWTIDITPPVTEITAGPDGETPSAAPRSRSRPRPSPTPPSAAASTTSPTRRAPPASPRRAARARHTCLRGLGYRPGRKCGARSRHPQLHRDRR